MEPSSPTPGRSTLKHKRTDEPEHEAPALKKRLAALLAKKIAPQDADHETLIAAVLHLMGKPYKPQSIAASDMNMDDVEEAFDLRREQEQTVSWSVSPTQVPSWALESLDKTSKVVLKWSTDNEAFARLMINQVLIAAIYMSSRRQELANATSSNSTPPAALGLALEVPLQHPVELHGEKVIIKGTADYAIYYEGKKKDKSAASLIALKAKRRFYVAFALPQLLAYMAIIHSQRKEAGRQNCVVWGFASDGVEYRFARIDNKGFVTFSRSLDFVGQEQQIIFGIICGIIKAAALASPYSSPEKNDEVRARIYDALGSRDPNRMIKFDYGLSEANYGLDPVPGPAVTSMQPGSEIGSEEAGAASDGAAERQSGKH